MYLPVLNPKPLTGRTLQNPLDEFQVHVELRRINPKIRAFGLGLRTKPKKPEFPARLQEGLRRAWDVYYCRRPNKDTGLGV